MQRVWRLEQSQAMESRCNCDSREMSTGACSAAEQPHILGPVAGTNATGAAAPAQRRISESPSPLQAEGAATSKGRFVSARSSIFQSPKQVTFSDQRIGCNSVVQEPTGLEEETVASYGESELRRKLCESLQGRWVEVGGLRKRWTVE